MFHTDSRAIYYRNYYTYYYPVLVFSYFVVISYYISRCVLLTNVDDLFFGSFSFK